MVTSACVGPPKSNPITVRTLVLLQAAFSHNGFAVAHDGLPVGAFRDVVTKARVKGPILVTHTENDWAVGVMYPLASRLSGDTAAALGGPEDKYGGIGRNGAQHTPEAAFGVLHKKGVPYSFTAPRALQSSGRRHHRAQRYL